MRYRCKKCHSVVTEIGSHSSKGIIYTCSDIKCSSGMMIYSSDVYMESAANIYKNGRLKTAQEMIEDGTERHPK